MSFYIVPEIKPHLYLGYCNVYIKGSPLYDIISVLKTINKHSDQYLLENKSYIHVYCINTCPSICINTCTSICTYPNVCTLMLPFASVENPDSITGYV